MLFVKPKCLNLVLITFLFSNSLFSELKNNDWIFEEKSKLDKKLKVMEEFLCQYEKNHTESEVEPFKKVYEFCVCEMEKMTRAIEDKNFVELKKIRETLHEGIHRFDQQKKNNNPEYIKKYVQIAEQEISELKKCLEKESSSDLEMLLFEKEQILEALKKGDVGLAKKIKRESAKRMQQMAGKKEWTEKTGHSKREEKDSKPLQTPSLAIHSQEDLEKWLSSE